MEWRIKDEVELDQVIDYLKDSLDRVPILLLSGDLGAGKTTLVRHLLKALESGDEVTSPTFSIINEYLYPKGTVYHMDMYRLKNTEEALDIGIEEYLDSEEICIIEWPEIIEELLPEKVMKLQIIVTEESERIITVE